MNESGQITIEMTANSGTAYPNDRKDKFDYTNGFEILTEFLKSRKEKELLKAVTSRATLESKGAWPGCKVAKVTLSEEQAIKLFNVLEKLTALELSDVGNSPPDNLAGIRTELLRKLDPKKLKFSEQ